MAAVALGLASGLLWGVADFVGGIKSQRLHVLAVVLVSQAAGLVPAGLVPLARGAPAPGGGFAAWAIASSVAGIVGLTAFYRALAVGAMGIVAPISSTAAAIPLVVGLASGDRPTALQLAGVALALGGVGLASRETAPAAPRGAIAAGVPLALTSAAGFGFFFVAMDHASDHDAVWAVVANRSCSVVLLGTAALVLRPRLAMAARDARALALVGLLDVSANATYALATTTGLLSLV